MFQILWLLLITLTTIHCNESLIQINFKKSVNHISDKFLSFIIDPKFLLNGHYTRYLSNTTEDIFESLGPAYIRLNMSPELKFHDGGTLEEVDEINRVRQIEFGIQEWKNLNKWTNKHNFVAVIQLEYDMSSWKARDTLRLLGVANDIGIKDCVWQLGSELNSTGINKYIEDFKAFETIIKIFPEEKTNWKVIPANFKEKLDVSETTQTFEEVKDVIYSSVWQQEWHDAERHRQNFFSSKDVSLKYLLKQEPNVWLQVINRPPWSSSSDCGSTCTQEGLVWAQILGDASRTGFQTIFKQIYKRDLIKPNYQHYVTKLFKHLVGSKVFSVTGLKGDKYLSHYYAYCAKNHTGGFVLMIVNAAETRLRSEFKLTFRHKKSEVLKYILTVCDGEICLNNKTLNGQTEITPIVKKKNTKRSIILSVPPQSVSFYEFPHANIGHCLIGQDSDEVDSDEEPIGKQKRSSVSKFLKDLALDHLNHEKRHYDVVLSRMKRQLASPFKDFNLFKQLTPPPKLPPPVPMQHNHLNNGKILLVNKPGKTKIPGVDDEPSSLEEKIFNSRENMDLPRGEMYLFVGPETRNKDTDYDYVEFDPKQTNKLKSKKKTMNTYLGTEAEEGGYMKEDEGVREQSVEVDTIDTFIDDFGGEFIRPASNKRKNIRLDDREIAEITASKTNAGYKRKSNQKQISSDENTQYAVLVKELAPTVRQNQINRKKAQKKLDQLALDETKQAIPEEVEEEGDDYEYFNEDDDRFFRSDENQNESSEKTKRNSPNHNKIDMSDKIEDIRFIKAFEKLLKKIEKKVSENSEPKSGTPVRTRRSIDSVHVPKRKTRKSLRTTETGKQISKAQPIDIKNIATRSLNQLRRKRELIDLNEKVFYELTNEIDEKIETEPQIYIKQLKHFHIIPSTEEFNISAEFVVQPKLVDKVETTTNFQINDELVTEFTTNIITPSVKHLDTNETTKINTASAFQGILKPFIDFYHNFLDTSKELWNSIFEIKQDE